MRFKGRGLGLFGLMLLPGCVPSFESVGCYSANDCPTAYTCIGRLCVSVDAGVDAAVEGSDAGVLGDHLLRPWGGAEGFGATIVPLGDINGDGYADLVIGAPQASSLDCPARCGRVYLYYGTSKGPVLQTVLDGPPLLDGQFGFRISAAGDLNGDGYADFAVASHQPMVHVFYGGADGISSGRADRLARTVLAGPVGRTRFGLQMGAADLDGDGFDDLVVNGRLFGQRQCDRVVDTSGVRGALWVYRGSARGIATRPVQLDWPSSPEAVCACQGVGTGSRNCAQAETWAFGAVDPGGETPLIVAAPGASGGRGEVVVLHLSRPGEVSERAEGVCANELIGSAAAPFHGVVELGDAQDRLGVVVVVHGQPECVDGLPHDQLLRFGSRGGVLGTGTPLDLLPGLGAGDRLAGVRRIVRGPEGRFDGLLLWVNSPQPTFWFSAWRDAQLQTAQHLAGSETSVGAAAVWWPKVEGQGWLLETRQSGSLPLAQEVYWQALP